jgi:hypothetical protein
MICSSLFLAISLSHLWWFASFLGVFVGVLFGDLFLFLGVMVGVFIGVPHTRAGCAMTPGLQILRVSTQNFEVI